MITSNNNRNGFVSPAIFFTFDGPKSGFSRNCILDFLQGESINIEAFQEIIIRNIEKKDNIEKGNNSISTFAESKFLDKKLINLTNAEILSQQRRELENILREEETQKRLKTDEQKRIRKEVQ